LKLEQDIRVGLRKKIRRIAADKGYDSEELTAADSKKEA
jgi:hypothetical protein